MPKLRAGTCVIVADQNPLSSRRTRNLMGDAVWAKDRGRGPPIRYMPKTAPSPSPGPKKGRLWAWSGPPPATDYAVYSDVSWGRASYPIRHALRDELAALSSW